tara:strand:+ start:191 stop:1144 length:954 start_codon:yes stop_codon:yes gene_type:complete
VKVLVLGGDGFLGSHFVDQALKLGHYVTVFDRFPQKISKNLEHVRKKVRLFSGELAKRESLSDAIEGQEIVCHFVSVTTPAESWNDPYIEIDDNLKSSIQLFELAGQKKVKKIIFPSSGGTIYGPQREAVDESVVPNPVSPHGIIKLAAEHFLHHLQERFNIGVDIFRIGNLYGPRQPIQTLQGVITVWMKDILNGAEIQIYGDHKTVRDYVYVEDAAYLMTKSLFDVASSDTYNLGSGIGTSIFELFEIFKRVIQRPIRYRIHPRRPSDNSLIVLDSSKLVACFPGFSFQKLENKIAETWKYFKNRYQQTISDSDK